MFNLEEKKIELSEKFTYLVSYKNKKGYFNGSNYAFLLPRKFHKILLFDEGPRFNFDENGLTLNIKHIASKKYISFVNEMSKISSKENSLFGIIKRFFTKEKQNIKIRCFSNDGNEETMLVFENVVLKDIKNDMFFNDDSSTLMDTKLTFKYSKHYSENKELNTVKNINIENFKKQIYEANEKLIENYKNESYDNKLKQPKITSENTETITSGIDEKIQ